MRFFKLALASLFAVLAMGVVGQSASAYDLSVSPAGPVAASGTLTFSDAGGLINITCPYTFDATLDAGPVALSAGSQLGTVDVVSIGSCTGGSAVALVDDPWPIQVAAVLGTQPNALTGLLVDVVGFSWEINVSIFGIPMRCLYLGTLGALFNVTGTNPYATGSTLTTLGNAISKLGGSSTCPSSARFNGTLAFGPSQTLTVS
jgi:hypothetical protein